MGFLQLLETSLIYQETTTSWTMTAILLRLFMAFLIGGVIGLDRGIKRRGAGIKTHSIICVSSALVMLTGQYIYMNFAGSIDIARLGAQVISGVGFLGMGTIIVTGHHQVRGLTTAATSWSCACLGLAIGCGFIFPAVIAALLILIILHLMPLVDNFVYERSRFFHLYTEFESLEAFTDFAHKMDEQNIIISEIDKIRPRTTSTTIAFFISFEVPDKQARKTFVTDINAMKEVLYVIDA